MNSKLNFYILLTVFFMFWSDLFNYIFAGTPLVAWKQLVAISYWIIAYKIATKAWHYDLLNISLAVGLVLFINSYFMFDVGVDTCLFNFLIYFTTPALLVVLLSCPVKFLLDERMYILWAVFVFLSVVGLLIDLNTDLFSFLPRNEMDSVFYLVNNEVKRASLFFPASTMAVPFIAAGAIYSTTIKNNSKWIGISLSASLPVAAFATGSVSSYFVAIACLIGIVATQKISIGGVFSGCIAISICAGLYLSNSGENSTVSKQMDRLLNNTHANSQSNMERQQYWDDAMKIIENFNVIDHLVGKGYGVTFPKFEKQIVYPHGESSFFQSHIELGLIGDLARVVPFIYIIGMSIRRKKIDVFLWGSSVFLAIALAPTAGSIPFQVLVALMLYFIATNVENNFQINEYIIE
ncbi:hypothetical protein HA050_20615 [Iodobacter sp. HSC-16F04]|uniref:O-antigen ligase domain-containing protein n=1 Tax=Iodobacter violaceini TaxID=3044271 RepID=A0ABX0KXI0_9NEIS|nr:O-antigen ligase family protein [Iodobacter violacea]NHQ88506.1 hypothetical protein [Iodobacter violacea]